MTIATFSRIYLSYGSSSFVLQIRSPVKFLLLKAAVFRILVIESTDNVRTGGAFGTLAAGIDSCLDAGGVVGGADF